MTALKALRDADERLSLLRRAQGPEVVSECHGGGPDALSHQVIGASWEDFARQLWALDFPGADIPSLELKRLQDRYNQYVGGVVLISPLYASSFCRERCIYCNFRAGNKRSQIVRRRLTSEEVRNESDYLIARGIRVIELVYASDPRMTVDCMCRHVDTVASALSRVGGGAVGINCEPLDEHSYRALKESGLDFIVLWQETYDEGTYRRVHPGPGAKSDYQFRVEAPERMISAGLKNIGMGVLTDLADWRSDWALLAYHMDWLQEDTGVTPRVLGVPRLKPAEGALMKRSESPIKDEVFLGLVYLFTLRYPNLLPFVNTRETWELCLRMAAGGGCLFTMNCSTIPGGYTLDSTGYQFPTSSFDALRYRDALREARLFPSEDFRSLRADN